MTIIFVLELLLSLRNVLRMRGRRSNNSVLPSELTQLFTSVASSNLTKLVRKAKRLDTTYRPPNFLNYYGVCCHDEECVKGIVRVVSNLVDVEQVQVETLSASPPSVVPDQNPLSVAQEYLDAAPLGIDARYAWTFPGGDGLSKVRFVDIEQGWLPHHEDLAINKITSTGINHYKYQDHGAAVLGVVMMRNNQVGGIGIVASTDGYFVSQWRRDGTYNTADAILAAISHLAFGDILLLETQLFDLWKTRKIWPVETLDVHFQLIRLATALGITVIEPAGNGIDSAGNDLDKFIHDTGNHTLNRKSTWFQDSGAALVAAATSRAPHLRMNYSNHGSRIDCYAWGENVVTAGHYPGSSGLSMSTYSSSFGGTSSASAIVAGAAIAVQSIAERNYGFRLDPRQMRAVLSDPRYGTESQNGHRIDKIGVMPDLRKIIDRALKNICRETAARKTFKRLRNWRQIIGYEFVLQIQFLFEKRLLFRRAIVFLPFGKRPMPGQKIDRKNHFGMGYINCPACKISCYTSLIPRKN